MIREPPAFVNDCFATCCAFSNLASPKIAITVTRPSRGCRPSQKPGLRSPLFLRVARSPLRGPRSSAGITWFLRPIAVTSPTACLPSEAPVFAVETFLPSTNNSRLRNAVWAMARAGALFRRIVPSLQLVHTWELDHDHALLRRPVPLGDYGCRPDTSGASGRNRP